jgi:hypothetical protein
MRVRDLQEFLSKFTESKKDGSRQGNAMSDAVIMVEIKVKTLGPCSSKSSSISMYRGSRIRELAACGLKLDACSLGLDACRLMLEELGA